MSGGAAGMSRRRIGAPVQRRRALAAGTAVLATAGLGLVGPGVGSAGSPSPRASPAPSPAAHPGAPDGVHYSMTRNPGRMYEAVCGDRFEQDISLSSPDGLNHATLVTCDEGQGAIYDLYLSSVPRTGATRIVVGEEDGWVENPKLRSGTLVITRPLGSEGVQVRYEVDADRRPGWEQAIGSNQVLELREGG